MTPNPVFASRPASPPAPTAAPQPAPPSASPVERPAGAADVPFERYPVHALMRITQRPAQVFTHGQGSWLWDSQGRAHLDLVQGWAVNVLGHAPPAVADALSTQARRLLQPGPGLYNDRAIELARQLTQLSGLDQCFFTSSGAEANEGAIKLARKFGRVHRGGAHEIITFVNAFHGRTLATMSASGKPGFDTLFAPQVPGFPKARLNDIDSVRTLVHAGTVAVLLEPIQGEAGVIEAEAGFLRQLRALCNEHGLLLMFDEIQTGLGRTGDLWGWQASGVRPDVMTLGKGLGGGVPIGALLAAELACCFEPSDQGGTYCGNALMCAAALAVLEAITAPGFMAAARARALQLRTGLDALAQRIGSPPVSGRGLLLALELPATHPAGALADALRDRAHTHAQLPGLLVNPVRPHRLRFVPALNISADEVDLALTLLEKGLSLGPTL